MTNGPTANGVAWASDARRERRRAFTIIELLVVIGVVVVLVSILIVAVAAATRTGQSANTKALMNSIKQALVRFQSDIGYLPPILGTPGIGDVAPNNHYFRKLFDPRGDDGQWGNADDVLPDKPDGTLNNLYDDNIQEWFSVTSLAEYLLGYGHHNQDGYGYVPPPVDLWADERPPLGIRDPGPDGVWGATVFDVEGPLSSRMSGSSPHMDTGKIYGPYLELKDQRLLASIDCTNGCRDAGGRLNLSFPGDGNFNDDNPKVIVDYWGNPIRFYRRLYAPGSLQSAYRTSGTNVPTLSDVYLLRPFDVKVGGQIDSVWPDASGDTTTTMALRSAEFALFSPGPDRSFNPDLRYDLLNAQGNDLGTDLANEDNIVELGP